MAADFATELQTKLSSPQLAFVDLLNAEIGAQTAIIKNFTQNSTPQPPSRLSRSLEKSGRDLWNLCIRLRRDAGRDPQLDSRTRFFALHMIEAGRLLRQSKEEDKQNDCVYILGLSATVGRICLHDGDVELSRMALQKAAELLDRLKAMEKDCPEGTPSHLMLLEADYLTLRIALAGSPSP